MNRFRCMFAGEMEWDPRRPVPPRRFNWGALAWVGALAAFDPNARAAGPTFERDIRPIVRAHCLECHGSQNVHKGGLDLRLRRLIVKGGESGPSIVPSHPGDSYLLDRVKNGEMPPGDHKVSAKEIETLERWIAAGAPTARPEPDQIDASSQVTQEDRAFWSFQPIRRVAVPSFAAADRVRTPIDALLLEAMRAKGLAFSPDAEKRTLIRRLALDLLGRLPEPDEVRTFLADESPGGYERLVDQYLASPHYGERWGRHWLDTAGYADSEGYDDQDLSRPEAFRFRDYVINAFNSNKSFRQFIVEQLAGDELVKPPYANLTSDAIEKLAATGFLRMAADGTGTAGSQMPVASNQMIADTIKIVSTSLLGLSVGCAQCHDHRYDPIPQEDYYRLRAVFEPALNWKNWRVPTQRRVSLYTDADRARAAAVEAKAAKVEAQRNQKENAYIAKSLGKELAKFEAPLAKELKAALDAPAAQRTAAQKALLDRYPSVNISPGTLYQYDQAAADDLKKVAEGIAKIRSRIPVQEFVRVLTENPGEAPQTVLFFRGDYQQPKQDIGPGDLTVCVAQGQSAAIPKNDPALPTTGRRLAYARRLTSGTHPLVGRVLVNRIWMNHFGRGLVGTPADFGKMGELPTHPQLLDWLADEFAATGWDLKRFHRLIVTSTAYRQSSARTPQADAVDPDNRYYARMNLRRLDAEVIRDCILQAAGVSFDRMFGPPVPVKEDAVGQVVVGVDTKAGANMPGADVSIGSEEFRRSVYIEVRRSRPVAMLRAFDAPVMETNCDRRIASTAATQSLMMMNSDFVLSLSARFAERLRRDARFDPRRQVVRAFEVIAARPPDASDVDAALAFLERQSASLAAPQGTKASPPPVLGAGGKELQPLTDFCQALLSSNDFLYVD